LQGQHVRSPLPGLIVEDADSAQSGGSFGPWNYPCNPFFSNRRRNWLNYPLSWSGSEKVECSTRDLPPPPLVASPTASCPRHPLTPSPPRVSKCAIFPSKTTLFVHQCWLIPRPGLFSFKMQDRTASVVIDGVVFPLPRSSCPSQLLFRSPRQTI